MSLCVRKRPERAPSALDALKAYAGAPKMLMPCAAG